MAADSFIQVIVPLRLEWEPYYALEGASVGDRVLVTFGHKEYVGVVSAVHVEPLTPPERIQPARPTGLPPVQAREIAFWRSIATYYLCTIGEVYKAAYPVLKQESEAVKVRADERLAKRLALLKEKLAKARKEETRERYAGEIGRLEAMLKGETPSGESLPIPLSPAQETAVEHIQEAFQQGKTVLLHGHGKTEVYLQMARETLAQGRSVLYLVPEINLSRQLEERVSQVFPQVLVYNSARSAAQRQAVAHAVREGKARLVLGTRSALFLPLRNLGLIILDQEQESSFKQDSPAPRYHARESAILLAGIHHARVLLGSATPSLESLYNAETGLFKKVDINKRFRSGEADILLINAAAEKRKKGMPGSFSLKLLEQMHRCRQEGGKVLLICRSKAAIPECEAELQGIFDARDLVLATPAGAKGQPAGTFALTAILQADSLLAKEDFRCDERAIQTLCQLRDKCAPGGLLAIQTWEAAHPVFREFTKDHTQQLLSERRQFGYPPFTRLIHVTVKDENEKRGSFLAGELAAALRRAIPGQEIIGPFQGQLRMMLPRDKSLLARKSALAAAVAAFEKERKYQGHIVIDVDPV